MILGVIILKKRYNVREYLSILMITIGIFICTYVSAEHVHSQKPDKTEHTSQHDEQPLSEHFWWVIGKSLISLIFN